jgi:hypothetical protein
VYCQSIQAKNAFYFELAGNGIYYSLNYDRILYQKNSFKTSARIGVEVLPNKLQDFQDLRPAMPIEVNALVGKGKHHIETGLGLTPYIDDKYGFVDRDGNRHLAKQGKKITTMSLIRIGYRYQKTEGGLMFRAGFTPILFQGNNFDPVPFAGVSIGKSF